MFQSQKKKELNISDVAVISLLKVKTQFVLFSNLLRRQCCILRVSHHTAFTEEVHDVGKSLIALHNGHY